MIIKYDDIILRAIEFEDLDLLREMINDPYIENMTGGGGLPVSKYQHEEWYKKIILNNDNQVRLIIDTEAFGAIGLVMLTDIDHKNGTAQFHSKIATKNNLRGKGYGTKATMALIKYAFEQMNLNCIYSVIIEHNEVSQHVKEKCGFKREAILRDRIYKNGKYNNLIVWSILKSEFFQKFHNS
ncbi:MAG: GNAT family N-acetyltransferase [Treponema sp.]|nr:GNAT family N-acetyltransferase [Treponema sp.]